MPVTGKRNPSENPSTAGDASLIQTDSKRCRRELNSPIYDLKRLLEFWFSGPNLSKDKHLTSALLAGDGWVSSSFFLTFNSVKQLSASNDDIIKAFNEVQEPQLRLRATNSGETLVGLTGGKQELLEIIEQARNGEDKRTIYVEPLPPHTSREHLWTAMSRFGKVQYISIPRYPNGKGKGFAFVEFRDEAIVANALARIPEIQLPSPNPQALVAIRREEWRKQKELYKEHLKAKKEEQKQHQASRTETQSPKPVLKHSLASRQDEEEGLASKPKNIDFEGPSEEIECSKSPDHRLEDEAGHGVLTFEKGLIVSISELKAPNNVVTRRALFRAFKKYGSVLYVDFSPKAPETCKVRFKSETEAKAAFNALSPVGGEFVLGSSVVAKVLEGEMEVEYWAHVRALQQARITRKEKNAAKTTVVAPQQS